MRSWIFGQKLQDGEGGEQQQQQQQQQDQQNQQQEQQQQQPDAQQPPRSSPTSSGRTFSRNINFRGRSSESQDSASIPRNGSVASLPSRPASRGFSNSQTLSLNMEGSAVHAGTASTSLGTRSSAGTTSTNSVNSTLGFFSNIGRNRAVPQDAEVERRVSLAARNLGDGVQRIVMAAKGKAQSGSAATVSVATTEWKDQLMQLLGGSDTNERDSDMDIMLSSKSCDKFVTRCLENEVAPNMIHCLRLLRVLELQHSTQMNAQGIDAKDVKPISSRATEKVSQLLRFLCKDPAVGEQLRPHLFGLLALSGASCPPSGVHVARAASQVIIAFSEHCLTKSLVWFLHDRKMVIHMTEDVKELCGTPSAVPHHQTSQGAAVASPTNSSNPSSLNLYGEAAEEHGLWAISLTTVVHLVVRSCDHGCVKLLEDFNKAKGNQVLQEAIIRSKSKHGKKLMELLPLLAGCVVEGDDEGDSGEELRRGSPRLRSQDTESRGKAQAKKSQQVASNFHAFGIMDEIMFRSLPLLVEYEKEKGRRPEITGDESFRGLASLGVKISIENVNKAPETEHHEFDLATDLLLACLQLYSDHKNNYQLLEDRKHLLSFYILSFPTFTDENLKILVFKTVEFVVTGVAGANASQPLIAMGEVFSALCHRLIVRDNAGLTSDQGSGVETSFLDTISANAEMIRDTFQKLLRFDNQVASMMISGGAISRKIGSVIERLLENALGMKLISCNAPSEAGDFFSEPPHTTDLDTVSLVVSRMLVLVMSQQSKRNGSLTLELSPRNLEKQSTHRSESHSLSIFLITAVKNLGDSVSSAALDVLHSIMTTRDSLELLQSDMRFWLSLVSYFTDSIGKMSRVSVDGSAGDSKQDDIKGLNKLAVPTLNRTRSLYGMVEKVLRSTDLAKDAFRSSGGFQSLVRIFVCMRNAVAEQEELEEESLAMLETVLSVINAATGTKSFEPMDIGNCQKPEKMLPLTLSADVLVDSVSTQYSDPIPSIRNLYSVRKEGFYLDLAVAIWKTGMLKTASQSSKVLDLAMLHISPSLQMSASADRYEKQIQLRNPDAVRLVLGLIVLLPDTEDGRFLAIQGFDTIIQLCDESKSGSTLAQFASCGICWSIVSPKEFATFLDDRNHFLHPRFLLLLRRIAAFSMSYTDFVTILRSVAGPMLRGPNNTGHIRLPVISASVRQKIIADSPGTTFSEWQEREDDLGQRLDLLCAIAEEGDRVPHCVVGGDTVNTISVLLHKTKIEDRLYKASTEGRLNFLEIESIDTNAVNESLANPDTSTANSQGTERTWSPLVNSGFSFSVWLRFTKPNDGNAEGNIYVLDISTISASPGSGSPTPIFFSVWYDLANQRFNVLSSSSYRGEPICFPVSPLNPDVWHHILLTYTPSKRTMMGRKSVFGIFVDGRPLEAEVRIDSVNLPPSSRVIIGAPNAAVAASGVVRGKILVWDLGPTLMLSTVLMELDATAIFVFGPEFHGLFWGDRPQRLSLSATGTSAFSLLADTGEPGSIASALRRREIARLEAAGTVSREMDSKGPNEDNDSLSSLGLLCTIPPECVVFAYRAACSSAVSPLSFATEGNRKWLKSGRLVNVARINESNDLVSTDASVYGKSGIVVPYCFADNVQWAGGPEVLMPIVNAVQSGSNLGLALRLIRASTTRHAPNLEAMQGGGGYQMLGVLLQGKKFVTEDAMDQCFAFAVHGFNPSTLGEIPTRPENRLLSSPPQPSDFWVFSDLDAMKQLLLNHQVWDLKSAGPAIPLRLLSFLNCLVAQKSVHKAFNSRRLHLVGIVRWTLHLMIEAAELYTAGTPVSDHLHSSSDDDTKNLGESIPKSTFVAPTSKWSSESPSADAVSVGGDPDNSLLYACKTLLRRVLTFMLTPGDLKSIAEATMFTVCIGGLNTKRDPSDLQDDDQTQQESNNGLGSTGLFSGAIARVYLLRLIEELVVDGVNEIIASGSDRKDGDTMPHAQPHAGGIANPNQAYLSTALLDEKMRKGKVHPRHNQAQTFLSAFANVFSPVWFAALLEGCHEEATASAVLRLMILMLQSSPLFAAKFYKAGGFAPLVLSIPKFSTCSSIIISLLSQLLHVSVLHLPCFPALDADQLNEVFEAESELSELMIRSFLAEKQKNDLDASCGIFSLLAECIGRNIQLAPFDNDLGKKARQTNEAILRLILYRHNFSIAFKDYCRNPDFLQPLAQILCLVYDEEHQADQAQRTTSLTITLEDGTITRYGALADVPDNAGPIKRFVGSSPFGHEMIQLLRMILSHGVLSGPVAAPLTHDLLAAYPIHASPQQVEAYHLVVIELCQSVVEAAIELGDPAALASSIGMCSVLLDRMMKGFFGSEAIFKCVTSACSILACLGSDSATSGSLGNGEVSILGAEAAHIARLSCLCALRRSREFGPYATHDHSLQLAILKLVAKNIQQLMVVPKPIGGNRKQMGQGTPTFPPPNSKLFPLWHSANISRCHNVADLAYDDLSVIDDPIRPFVVALMVEIQLLLLNQQDFIRENAISIVVALIQQRRDIMSGILIKEIQQDDRVDTIDVMNRGGFGALLVAHEAASSAGASSAKKNYSSFFEWYARNQAQVQLVFADVQTETQMLLPCLESGAIPIGEAVEIEQTMMMAAQTAQDASDRTIIGGLERAELAQQCIDETAEIHVHWKRQGFDDLASGATKWKFLLRRLKGSCSIWEGGSMAKNVSISRRYKQLIENLSASNVSLATEDDQSVELVTRWKLDLTEGTERQRRRLLPNYEFHSLYNLDERVDHDAINGPGGDQDVDEDVKVTEGADFHTSDSEIYGMEATAELLRELNIKTISRYDDDDDADDEDDDEGQTLGTTVTGEDSATDNESITKELKPLKEIGNVKGAKDETNRSEIHHDSENATSYELITGLLQAGDWPEDSFNVRRCTGLEVRKALLLWCQNAIYIIDGFEQTDGEGLEGKITRVEKELSSYNVNLRPKDFQEVGNKDSGEIGASASQENSNEKATEKAHEGSPSQDSSNEVTYQHRSQRISFNELRSVFRRRYELQQSALEFYDMHNNGTLIAFSSHGEREEVLSRVLSTPLPNSIFNSNYGSSINYKKFMNTLKSKIVSQWVNGKMTNFEFLMHLNSFAGRTYNDLTQYPVFPWVIADYDSDEIDLNDPKTYRDLSKPMGALGEDRAQQFKDRYDALEANCFNQEEPPPFHYGTHYSCAAYVLYYLMRLEPFSRLALTLQGGRFDVADRLFHNIGNSWKSASEDNLQDVRELIPEFYYLPDFLTNTNHFDFGSTQNGKTVHDVTLPKWAKGDPTRFIRINRQALESDYVSKNLHSWIDLIFGYKQRGPEAVKALNTFVHVTYEGEVDLDAMADPVQRESTIAQIQNFGQTPSRLERRPFPQRFVARPLKEKSIDFGSLSYLGSLTPPFCIVGAPHRCQVKRISSDTCKLGTTDQADKAVGDLCLVKGQLVGVGRMCTLNIPAKKFYRYGNPNFGLSVHIASSASRNRELNKMVSIHDGLHRAQISVVKASLDGRWFVTGCIDSTVRVWKYEDETVQLCATFCGHDGSKITSLDISTAFGTIATGCSHGKVLLWDLRTLTFVRQLRHQFKGNIDVPNGLHHPTTSVSVNQKNGNIVTLVGSHLSVFDINGKLLGTEASLGARPTCAIATDCPEWMENGIVAVTGHVNGEVRFWSLDYDTKELTVRYLLVDIEHTSEITALRVSGTDRHDTLLVGDLSGKMSICKTLQLENMSSKELSEIVSELRAERDRGKPVEEKASGPQDLIRSFLPGPSANPID